MILAHLKHKIYINYYQFIYIDKEKLLQYHTFDLGIKCSVSFLCLFKFAEMSMEGERQGIFCWLVKTVADFSVASISVVNAFGSRRLWCDAFEMFLFTWQGRELNRFGDGNRRLRKEFTFWRQIVDTMTKNLGLRNVLVKLIVRIFFLAWIFVLMRLVIKLFDLLLMTEGNLVNSEFL